MNTKILVLCLLFTAATGVAILALTPYGGFPDEESHFEYSRYMHFNHRLPPISFDVRQTVTPEGFQPPFYYFLGSLLVSSDQAASITRIRILSLAFALLTVFVTWKSASLVFGHEHPATALATVIVATNAQFVFTFSGITNMTATVCTCALAFYFALRMIDGSSDVYKNAFWMGVCYGLAIMSRTITAFLIVPVATAMILRTKKLDVHAFLSFGIPVIVIAGWWYLRNWIYYEDPLLWKLHAVSVGSEWVRREPLNWFYILKQSAFLHASYWAYFGRNEYHAGVMEYAIYLLFEVLGTIGFLELLFRKDRGVGMNRQMVLLICLTAILGVGEILWLQTKLSIPQGRYFYISLVPISLVLASGILTLFPAKWERKNPALVISLLLAAMSLYLLGRYYFPRIV